MGTKCHINSSSTGALKRGGRVVEWPRWGYRDFIHSRFFRGKKSINGQSFHWKKFLCGDCRNFSVLFTRLTKKNNKAKLSKKKRFKLRFDITQRRIFPTFYFFHRNHPEKKIDISDKNYKKKIYSDTFIHNLWFSIFIFRLIAWLTRYALSREYWWNEIVVILHTLKRRQGCGYYIIIASLRTVGRRLQTLHKSFKISLFHSSAHGVLKESETKKRICFCCRCCAETLWQYRNVSRGSYFNTCVFNT